MTRAFLLAALFAVGLMGCAQAQIPGGGVSQVGTVTAGHCTSWVGPGQVQDSGGDCGGTGSPGGTAGQIQYNNAGAFGGFTASGDCTIVTSTGVVTCLDTNGVPFTVLATTAPGTGVATALGVNIGSAGAFVTFNGALGTPSSATLTNATGLPLSTAVT